MRATSVERLLARVDGELATIWITAAFLLSAPLSPSTVVDAVVALVRESPRFHQAWRDDPARWVSRPRSDEEVRRAVFIETVARSLSAVVSDCIASTVDLRDDLPLRVTVATRAEGGQIVVVQLHHAVGDGRALMMLTRRLWEHCAGIARPEGALGRGTMSDRRLLAFVAQHPRGLLSLGSDVRRVLARRGHALPHREAPGKPRWSAITATLPFAFDDTSGLFYGSLLAGMRALDPELANERPVRLRVPVDLRRAMGLGAALENASSALVVELDHATLATAMHDPLALAALVPTAIRVGLARGDHLAVAMECLVASWVASAATLRRHVRPDLVAAVRANTMVTTYVGRADRYTAPCPVPVEAVLTHTPTCGANGLRLGDKLIVNVSSFAGYWSDDDRTRFVDGAAQWLAAHEGITVERLL